jgi:Protein of unknown function (DUF2809)
LFFNKRKWTILAIALVIPLGFYTKLYSGPLADWVNNSLGGVLYVIFWSLLLFLIFPKISSFRIAVIVFLLTCVIEFLQLWHPVFLETIRSTFLGRTILGQSFSWWDIFHYAVGCVISSELLEYLNRSESNKTPESKLQ